MMLEDDDHTYNNDRYNIDRLVIPTWGFILLFLGPSILTLGYLSYNTTLDTTATAIIALAVMNGSINSVIAWMTIRLDGHSNDAMEHMDEIMLGMENLDDTMEAASEMVTNFNTDLEEAKSVFAKVGVDLTELDLEPLAEVVEKLKENKILPRRYFRPSLDTLSYLQSTQNCELSRDIADRILCLPIYPGLSKANVTKIIELVSNE